MPHSLDENGNLIVNLNDYNHIKSVRFRDKISYLCQDLSSIANLKYFSICIIYKDIIPSIIISNMVHWSIPYHTLGYKRSDADFAYESLSNKPYYFHKDILYDELQQEIIKIMNTKYHIYDTFALIRECSECVFILEAYHNYLIIRPQEIYLKAKDKFEDFCIEIISELLDNLVEEACYKQHLLIFRDKKYLSDVIKDKINYSFENLTLRELECLRWIRMGKTADEIAIILSISVHTVQTYLKNIRAKMQATSISQALANAINLKLII